MGTRDRPVDGVDWVAGIRAGNRAAFADLFQTFHEPLCSYACRFVRSPEVAQDLVQDVFLNIWRLESEWDPKCSVRAYLYRAVRNRTVSYHEHHMIEASHKAEFSQGTSSNAPRTPLEELSYADLAAEIQTAIQELPERRRQIFILNRIHRLTYDEIANALDISVNTVDTQMRRALKSLRERFRTHLPTNP